ncbi:MAG: DNA methyltransferase [Bacteroidia bacterium]
MNHLYFGDCLQILKQLNHKNPDGFIDLIYIDPPFNSKRNYNVLFESIDLKDATAQKQAFADTWSNVSYIDTINELAEINKDLYTFLKTLSNIRISDSAVAYLSTMAIRILYMRKALKDTGSFYLHCDPTMSHYLKIVCDLIFGEKNFRSEIIWQRADAHNDPKNYGSIHDVILFYSKEKQFKWNHTYTPYSKSYLTSKWSTTPSGRRYKCDDMTDPRKSMKEYDFMGTVARWRTNNEKMLDLWNAEQTDVPNSHGRIKLTQNGIPRKDCKITFLEEREGIPLQDLWTDINSLRGGADERLGYPTQKPLSLLERIIKTSSSEGDLVADFFCGCGTTVAAAQKLNRNWLGVDISHLAVRLIAKRLVDTYGLNIKHNFRIDGFPQDAASARMLATENKEGRFNFQEWVIEVLLNGVVNTKKTGDGGYDGYLTFYISEKQKEFVLVEVKSGTVNVKNIREFIQVIEKQKAAIGLFVCFEDTVTKEMLKEIKQAGNYHYTGTGYESDFPKIQILTIEDLLDDRVPKIPQSNITTFRKAQQAEEPGQASLGLFD